MKLKVPEEASGQVWLDFYRNVAGITGILCGQKLCVGDAQ